MGRNAATPGRLGQGAQPHQTPQAKIKQIQKMAKEGTSISAISKATGVSRATVKKYAEQVGAGPREQTEGLKLAVERSTLDLKARRQQLAVRMLDEVDTLLDSLHQPQMAFSFGGKDNVYTEQEIPEPPAADKKHIITSATLLMQKHIEYIKHDNDNGAGEAVSLISKIVNNLNIPPEINP